MTKAEEKSIVYQLATHGPRVMGGAAILSEEDYKFWNINYDFKAGYEQGQKETIERAVKWLKENAEDYVFTCLGKEKLQSRLWDDLKKAMEEEK